MIEVDAKPFAFRFDPARAALVVIDMQRDFLEPGGFGETGKPGKGMFRAINVAQILKETRRREPRLRRRHDGSLRPGLDARGQ